MMYMRTTKMLSVAMHESFAGELDRLIATSGLYSSRSEFLKDAIRKNYLELVRSTPNLMEIRGVAEAFAAEAKKKGRAGKKPSNEEREQWAREFLAKLKP